jgi:hypothetical protein
MICFLLIGWRNHTFEDGIIQAKFFPEALVAQYFLTSAQGSCVSAGTVLLLISNYFLIKYKLIDLRSWDDFFSGSLIGISGLRPKLITPTSGGLF